MSGRRGWNGRRGRTRANRWDFENCSRIHICATLSLLWCGWAQIGAEGPLELRMCVECVCVCVYILYICIYTYIFTLCIYIYICMQYISKSKRICRSIRRCLITGSRPDCSCFRFAQQPSCLMSIIWLEQSEGFWLKIFFVSLSASGESLAVFLVVQPPADWPRMCSQPCTPSSKSMFKRLRLHTHLEHTRQVFPACGSFKRTF